MSLFYRIAYLVGFKPWDTGVTPPELVAVVEGPGELPPHTALELGCGTGTNAIYLAQHGWDVTAVDFTPQPVKAARRKAEAAGVEPRFVVGDVTQLERLGVGGGYSLIFDLGCFHSIPEAGRGGYARGVTAAAAPGATFLLFGDSLPARCASARSERHGKSSKRGSQRGRWRMPPAARAPARCETWRSTGTASTCLRARCRPPPHSDSR